MTFRRNAIAYATTILAASMMHSVFYFYYVKLFLDQYHVSQMWFQFAQVIYLIWNTLNDPLFGYFQDNSSWEIFKNRQKSILYGAPLYSLCFLLPWFPWGSYPEGSWVVGLHLLISLCAYDALFTFVLLAECALFAEMSQHHEDRLQLVQYAQIASVIGSTAVFLSNAVSNNMKNMLNLQIFCILIAIIAWLCMRYTAINAQPHYDKEQVVEKPLLPTSSDVEEEEEAEDMSCFGAWSITKQILSNHNFLSFVFMNFFQELHGTFCMSFLIIFGDHLIPDEMLPSIARSFLYGASFFIPQLLVVVCGGIIARVGYFYIFLICFVTQSSAAFIMYIIGREHYWLLAMFFILDLSLTFGASKLINLPLSDVVDEDRIQHAKKNPRSAMVFATNALVTKPSQSILPMAVVAILDVYGYKRLKDISVSSSTTPATSEKDLVDLETMHDVMFNILCGLPFFVCLLQIVIWCQYKIRDSHTAEPKYIET